MIQFISAINWLSVVVAEQNGVFLELVELKNGKRKRLRQRLNAVLGIQYQWLADSSGLIAAMALSTRTPNNFSTAARTSDLVANGLTSNEYAFSFSDNSVPFSVTSGRRMDALDAYEKAANGKPTVEGALRAFLDTDPASGQFLDRSNTGLGDDDIGAAMRVPGKIGERLDRGRIGHVAVVTEELTKFIRIGAERKSANINTHLLTPTAQIAGPSKLLPSLAQCAANPRDRCLLPHP